MKGIFPKIIYKLKFYLGENENYSIENRLFISSLLIGVFLGLVGAVTNYFLVEHWFSVTLPLLACLILCFFYYLARFRGYFKRLAFLSILLAFFIISVIWLLNGGIDGANDLIFVVALMLGFIIVSNREKFYVLIFYTIVKTALYFIQHYYPDIIIHYSSEQARWLDVLLTSFYSSIIILLIISFLQRSYHNEREKVEKANSEMALLNEKLEDSNAAKDLLLSIISHDLRSPFSAMMGLSQVLVNNAEKADREKIKEYAKAINSSAVETYFLLDNLLKWSGLQKEGIFPKKEPADLSAMTCEIISLYKDHAAQKNIEIKNSISKPVNAFCDVELTKTILRNLLTNAIKFTNPGGKIEIFAEEIDNRLEIKVSDTGVGISEDKLKELFSLKKNRPERGTKNEKGTGLGLTLCKVLIEAQGGRLWVQSEPGKGSDFYFTLEKQN